MFATGTTSQTVKPQLLALDNSPFGSSPQFKNIFIDVSYFYRLNFFRL
jgi:hypothetical protein